MGTGNLHNTSAPHIFAYHINKYLRDDAELEPNVVFSTCCGNFSVNFVVFVRHKPITGFQFTNKRFLMDSDEEWRDAMILGDRHLENIYSIPEIGIKRNIDDVLYAISQWNPNIFSARGLINLQNLASTPARKAKIAPNEPFIWIYYSPDPERDSLWVEQRWIGLDEHVDGLYRFAKSQFGKTLEEIRATYDAKILGRRV